MQLKGVFPAMATPLTPEEKIDKAGYRLDVRRHRRLRQSRRDRVDPNVPGSEIICERAHHMIDAGLCAHVGGMIGKQAFA